MTTRHIAIFLFLLFTLNSHAARVGSPNAQNTMNIGATNNNLMTAYNSMQEIESKKIDLGGTRFIRHRLVQANAATTFAVAKNHQRYILEQTFDTRNGQEILIRNDIAVADNFIVQFKDDANIVQATQELTQRGFQIIENLGSPKTLLARKVISSLAERDQLVTQFMTQKPYQIRNDYVVFADNLPNDVSFVYQWGLRNAGQFGGSADADISAEKAWDINQCDRSVLIGVIDTGISRTHEDIKDNYWQNPGETGLDAQGNDKSGNGVDDDQNGYVDDAYGWDFLNNDNDPSDDNFHGTHVAGIIGATGNNGTGVSGVCWSVSLVGLKFLGANGSGVTSDAIKAVYYASMIGVNATNNSWGGGGYQAGLEKAIQDAESRDIGFIAAAGNDGDDLDIFPHFPASYRVNNIIAVANTNDRDVLNSSSNFGNVSVDLAAPGTQILSAGNSSDSSYVYATGTSMAAPFVSGAYALLKSRNPSLSTHQIKNFILASAEVKGTLQNKVASGGRLDIEQALALSTLKPLVPGEIPVGAIIPWGGNATSIPMLAPDWKLCSIRTPLLAIKDYPDLFAAIGFNWTNPLERSSNPGKFRIPYFDGMFMRGVDSVDRNDFLQRRSFGFIGDPDKDKRFPLGMGNIGDAASLQQESTASHSHGISTSGPSGTQGGLDVNSSGPARRAAHSGHNHKVEIVNTTPRFPSQETRPKNIAVNYIIRVN